MIEINDERKSDDLTGMDAAGAKEYILHHITALKLTEKQREDLDREWAKWQGRIELARSRGDTGLAAEAEGEAERVKARQGVLQAEAAELTGQIEKMRRQLPGLAARQRSVDPDLLEQELLMAAGRMPGEEKEAARDREFEKLEKEKAAQDALEALKARAGLGGKQE
jgi:phage shock protein A